MTSMDSSGGDDALYMREIRTRTTLKESPVTADPSLQASSSHTSLGRLLRLVADPRSDENHMEQAIIHVSSGPERIASDAIDQSPPVKALSDHRHISNLETVLRAVDRAIAEPNASSTTAIQSTAASSNLLRALASALVTQSVEECSSTKLNLCVWTSQSKKRLLLLQWLLHRSPEAARIILADVVGGVFSSHEPQAKTSQLAACLVVFELAQRMRRGLSTAGIHGHWAALIDPLIRLIQSNTVQTPTGVKPTKLGVLAMDALIAVLCVAAIASASFDASVLMIGMEYVLQTLIQWNARSSKRQWLLVAVRQLLGMVTLCQQTKSNDALEMAAWHWNASAMWLCSRSDVVLAAKKRLAAATTRTIHELHDGLILRAKSTHSTVAMLCRLCSLHGLYSGATGELRKAVFTGFEVVGKLLLSLATALAAPVSRKLSADMLRLYLLGKANQVDSAGEPLLLLTDSETRSFIALVVKLSIEAKDSKNSVVASLIAALCLASRVSITSQLHASRDTASVLFWLSVLSEAITEYHIALAQDLPLWTRWFRDATLAVLELIQNPDKSVRVFALRMLSKLNMETAMQAVGSTLLYELDPKTSGGMVTLLFLYAETSSPEPRTVDLAKVLIEALHKGPTATPKPINKPSDFEQDAVTDTQAHQALAIALSVQGWCSQATQSMRRAVLSCLVQNVFASPRHPWPLSWLRELSLLGWFDSGLADVLPIMTSYMQSVERLTENLLEDNSAQASATVEQLLFARLAPNLVLRVIPRSAFHALYDHMPVKLLDTLYADGASSRANADQHCLPDLTQLLWSQALDPLEFKDVKMLATELLTKLPAHEILPHVLVQLQAFLSEQGCPLEVLHSLVDGDKQSIRQPTSGGDFVTAKLMMYYLNRLFTDDANSSSGGGRGEDKMWSVLLSVLSLPCEREKFSSAQRSPLVDLQMGAIECLALLVTKSLRQTQQSTDRQRRRMEDLVVELLVRGPVATDGVDHISKWQAAVHDVEETRGYFSTSQLQICCCNVLLSTLSKLDDAMLPVFQERVVRSILPTASLQQLQESALAGCLQVAFAYIFRAGATLEPTATAAVAIVAQCVSTIVEILDSRMALDDQVYMSTLRLLGALISKVSWLWPSLENATQRDLAAGLQNLRDTSRAVSPPVRQLAQSLRQAIVHPA